MKSKLLGVVLIVVSLSGCASAGWFSGLFTAKLSDKVQVAEKVTGIENAKVADTATSQIGSNIQANKTETHAGRDVSLGSGNTTNNDGDVMKEYIRLMKYMIKLLCGIVATQFATMMGLIGWVIKFLLKQDSKKDDFMEKLLNK